MNLCQNLDSRFRVVDAEGLQIALLVSSYNLKNRKSISLKTNKWEHSWVKKTLHPLEIALQSLNSSNWGVKNKYESIIDKTVIYIQMHVKIIQIATCLLKFTNKTFLIVLLDINLVWKISLSLLVE